MKKRLYYIAVNEHRTSVSNGFANTWTPYQCKSRKHQIQILREGLPVSDTWFANGDPIYSRLGIRLLTKNERARLQKDYYGILTINTQGEIYP